MGKQQASKTIPWWIPSLGKREKELVCEVIDSNFINDGDYTTAFERAIAEVCEVPYAVAVTSGTAALFLSLAALDIGPGDEVIVPDITFIASANAVRLTGADVVLVDVCADSLNIDPACVEKELTSRTKAIMPVHVSGRAANLTALLEIAQSHNLYVIEDAAEALGSNLCGRPLGSIGDAGCFSFSPNKTITTGQGGLVVTANPDIYKRLRELKDQGRPVRGTGGDDEHVSLGYNFKLTNVQAAIGLAQLESFGARIQHLRQIFSIYQEYLTDVPGIGLPGFDIQGGECPQWVDALVDNRDSLYSYLLARGIETRKFWFPLHTQAPYRGPSDESFPASMQVSANGIWLPSALSLTEEDVKLVCYTILEWSSQAFRIHGNGERLEGKGTA